MIIWPTSTPIIPAAVNGPGVGGTITWVHCRPQARARARAITDLPVTRDIALHNGAKITIAESAKTGMDTSHPVIPRASSSFPLPIFLMKENAIRSAAPVFSRIPPIITPRPMMIPVLFKVFPKPSWIAVMASDGDILPIRPVISAASSSAMKVWVLVFITRKIMIAMPKNRPSSIWVSCDIFHTSFCSVLTSYASNMGGCIRKAAVARL